MSTVVFVGPSLPEAAELAPRLLVRPPAARGDLIRFAGPGVRIGLVDGVFAESFAVSPTECRRAHEAGATVFGAASMGALRAADCPRWVIPVGRIAAMFCAGELEDDDEVACTFLPHTYTLHALPLVNIRCALELVGRGDLIVTVKNLPFRERTLEAMLELAGSDAEPLKAALLDPANDLKRRDALELIRLLDAPR